MEEFLAGMKKLGYVEGKDVEYLRRYPDSDDDQSLQRIADELVRAKPDVIVTAGTWLTTKLARATSTIPIVTNVGDPVGAGFAKSLARPGGNITGWSQGTTLYEKQLEYLKAIIPGKWALALAVDDSVKDAMPLVRALQEAARKTDIPVRTVSFQGMNAAQADRAIAAMRGQGIRVFSPMAEIAGFPADTFEYTQNYGLVIHPSGGDSRELLSYWSVDDDAQERKAAQVVRILRGTPPGEMPFETPTRYRLTVNRTTARLLGVTIPTDILLRADQVYD